MNGSCLCGLVKYEVRELQPDIANCYCSMCRKFSGSAYGVFGTVLLKDMCWLEGEDAITVYPSSERAERGFCSRCGSSLYYRLREENSPYEIALGTLDGEPDHVSNANIYCGSRAKWAVVDNNLRIYNEGRTG